MAGARLAATLDSIQVALSGGRYEGVVLVTDGLTELPELPSGVTVDVDSGPFHFGSRLAEVVRRHDLERVVYLGGGSLPLLGVDEFSEVAEALSEGGVVVTNNHFSSDLVAFPAGALARIEPPDSDNRLARALSEEGVSPYALFPAPLPPSWTSMGPRTWRSSP